MLRILSLISIFVAAATANADPLPSWNAGEAKSRIMAFVDSVTDPASDDYVTTSERIAVFDNDGTLWGEQPVYFQFLFAMDQLARMAEQDPSILTTETLKAAAAKDFKTVLAGGDEALLEVVMASHSGLTVDAFQDNVTSWIAEARHPDTGRPYSEMLYQPMLELLSYLRDEGFDTYIVSGGGVDFMRAFAEVAYGIPPEQVIGSSGKTSYQVVDGVPTLMKDPGIAFIDDKEGKPVAINAKIGKRPILVAGNSDGDFQMLEWATAGDGPRFGLIVHHTDGAREYAYDRDSHIGRLERGLDEGPDRGWLIVDMSKDWSRVWPQDDN